MDKSKSIYFWFLFLLNPFVSMLLALKTYTKPYTMNIFWAFCVFYGLAFTIGTESTNSDIVRYTSELEYLYTENNLSFNEALEIFYTSGEIDILRSIISFGLSRFTDSQAILTMVYAFFFGYFYSRNIWYVFKLLKGKLNLSTKLFLFALIILIPIWSINGFRMWTAFHVFMFGLLPYIFENNKNKLVFVVLSVAVHFSFLVPVFITILYFLGFRNVNLIFALFFVSIFISEFDVGILNKYVDEYVPKILVERSRAYRSEAVIEARSEIMGGSNRNWYVEIYQLALNWVMISFLFYFFIKTRKFLQNRKELLRLFILALLFFTTANILSYLPSGLRYYSFANFLTLLMVVLYSNYFYKDFKFMRLTYFSSPAIILYVLVSIRIGLYSTSITTLLGNPLIAILGIGEGISLNDLIK